MLYSRAAATSWHLAPITIIRRCANDEANSRMCGLVGVVVGQWLVAGSSFPRGRVRHEKGNGAVGNGRPNKVFKSPRVAGSRRQECGRHDNRVGDDTRL